MTKLQWSGNWKLKTEISKWRTSSLPLAKVILKISLISEVIKLNRGKTEEQKFCPKISTHVPASGSGLYHPQSHLVPCSRCGSQTSSVHITRKLKKYRIWSLTSDLLKLNLFYQAVLVPIKIWKVLTWNL